MLIPGGEHEGGETLVAVIMKGQSTSLPGRDGRETAEQKQESSRKQTSVNPENQQVRSQRRRV